MVNLSGTHLRDSCAELIDLLYRNLYLDGDKAVCIYLGREEYCFLERCAFHNYGPVRQSSETLEVFGVQSLLVLADSHISISYKSRRLDLR